MRNQGEDQRTAHNFFNSSATALNSQPIQRTAKEGEGRFKKYTKKKVQEREASVSPKQRTRASQRKNFDELFAKSIEVGVQFGLSLQPDSGQKNS